MTGSVIFVALVVNITIISGESTVGKACQTNSTCRGQNEYCAVISWLSPGCKSGACECLPSFTAGDSTSTGNKSKSNDCVPLQQLNIGDSCAGAFWEQILQNNAACKNGTVSCNRGFIGSSSNSQSKSCMPIGLGEDDVCRSDNECAGQLVCGSLSTTCTCPRRYEFYDSPSGNCIARKLGDSCTDDNDCPNGAEWSSGFVYNFSSICNASGRCACGSSGHALVNANFFDRISGGLKTISICMAPLKSRNNCTNLPSNDGSLDVCDSNQVCITCPEDEDFGKCYNLPDSPTSTMTIFTAQSEVTTLQAIGHAVVVDKITTSTLSTKKLRSTSLSTKLHSQHNEFTVSPTDHPATTSETSIKSTTAAVTTQRQLDSAAIQQKKSKSLSYRIQPCLQLILLLSAITRMLGHFY